jgi:hypothetical protein
MVDEISDKYSDLEGKPDLPSSNISEASSIKQANVRKSRQSYGEPTAVPQDIGK